MKKTVIALGLLLASASAAAGIMNNSIDMEVITSGEGAWILLKQNGEPIQGANVTLSGSSGEYITPENGIVYVRPDEHSSRFATFTVTLGNGQEISKRVMLPRDHTD